MAQRSQAPRLLHALGLSVSLAACGGGPPAASGGDLVAHPGVSAPVLAAVGRGLVARPSRATAATAFDCQTTARALIPWQGTDFTSPLFRAACEAQLPDAPEFTERRAAACAVLRAGATQ
ncbi:MAG: hypothetical protein PHS14_14470 [Elusimicrobia bacterium]|nr:hypothetical protein [Elusimicrobiota bacterium]